ncbi:MAG: hypothetical protein WCY51_02915 [Sulfurimonas sp.]|uniref:hypothetical protein n=1 Tax=Sulfurimonas sp. TaxID=2022749 RepID=UPI0025F6A518|nr:hypothetical protein [Sulfurimonas sp.]MCK9453879.1 hypothetical protein [Sulfurimonas sp.]
MKNFILITLLSLILSAQNPTIYSQLGDQIYNNAQAIHKLKDIDKFSQYKKEIQEYIKDVNSTKLNGFAIELGDKSIDNLEYLQKLRELSKKDINFTRIAKNSFQEAIKEGNSRLFAEILNSGIIKIDDYKDEIFEFYSLFKDEIFLSDEVMSFIQSELEKQKSKQEAKGAARKEETQAQRIKWLREKDRAKEQKIKELLEEELLKKKREIREHQKEELLGN